MQSSFNKISLAFLMLCVCDAKCDIAVLPDVIYYNITTTPRADIFLLHHQHQFDINVKQLEQSLLNFQTNYDRRLDVIGLNIEMLETKLAEVDNKLNPLVLLDDINDYCVHKFRSKLPQIVQLTAKMKECTMKGTNAYASIVSGAETTLRNLKNYYASTFASDLNVCKKKNAGHYAESNYTACISAVINYAVIRTETDTNTFKNNLKAAECTTGNKVREIFDCYTLQVFAASKTIGEVMGSVDNCISFQDFCPSCMDERAVSKDRCPYQLSWHLANDDLTADKISNPFKGITKTTPCLQINFITKVKALN